MGCVKPVEKPFATGCMNWFTSYYSQISIYFFDRLILLVPTLLNLEKCEKFKQENSENELIQYINTLDKFGMSEVHYASWFGTKDVLQWLIQNGGKDNR
jgi:hypothetical protein